MRRQASEIVGLASSVLQIAQQVGYPVKAGPARRAPTTRFLGEELLEVSHHADRTGAIVEDDHRAGAEPTADLLDRLEVHGDIEVLGEEKIGRGAARQQPSELNALLHAARVLVEHFA